jgi:hypothetical protein
MVGTKKVVVILWRSQCLKVFLWTFVAFHLFLSKIRRNQPFLSGLFF